MRPFNLYTGIVVAVMISLVGWWAAQSGAWSPTFEDDPSIREGSADGSRTYLGGGLRGGK